MSYRQKEMDVGSLIKLLVILVLRLIGVFLMIC